MVPLPHSLSRACRFWATLMPTARRPQTSSSRAASGCILADGNPQEIRTDFLLPETFEDESMEKNIFVGTAWRGKNIVRPISATAQTYPCRAKNVHRRFSGCSRFKILGYNPVAPVCRTGIGLIVAV
jgi:hypothetical protein